MHDTGENITKAINVYDAGYPPAPAVVSVPTQCARVLAAPAARVWAPHST